MWEQGIFKLLSTFADSSTLIHNVSEYPLISLGRCLLLFPCIRSAHLEILGFLVGGAY